MINYAGKKKLGSDDDQVETAEDLKRGMTNEEWETVYSMTKVITIFPAFFLAVFRIWVPFGIFAHRLVPKLKNYGTGIHLFKRDLDAIS
jgi:hypothetical protein